jgi:hypothetical protein
MKVRSGKAGAPGVPDLCCTWSSMMRKRKFDNAKIDMRL